MIKWKKTIKTILLIFIICFAFLLGSLFGFYRTSDIWMAQCFNSKIATHFGIKTQFDRGKYEVVGGIHWKDQSFPIIIENGVKTIRAYRFISQERE